MTEQKHPKKIGISKTMPKSDVKPLGTPAAKRSAKKASVSTIDRAKFNETLDAFREALKPELSAAKVVDTPANAPVDSSTVEHVTIVHTQKEKIMSALALTLDSKARKSTSVVFKLGGGLRGSVRIAKTAFANGIPQSLNLQSDSENVFAEPKPRLTAEQRKELRKNAPKLTAAQKLENLQKRGAKLQAQIAAGASA